MKIKAGKKEAGTNRGPVLPSVQLSECSGPVLQKDMSIDRAS